MIFLKGEAKGAFDSCEYGSIVTNWFLICVHRLSSVRPGHYLDGRQTGNIQQLCLGAGNTVGIGRNTEEDILRWFYFSFCKPRGIFGTFCTQKKWIFSVFALGKLWVLRPVEATTPTESEVQNFFFTYNWPPRTGYKKWRFYDSEQLIEPMGSTIHGNSRRRREPVSAYAYYGTTTWTWN